MKAVSVILSVLGILLIGFGARYVVSAVQTDLTIRDISSKASDPTSEPVMGLSEARDGFMSGCNSGTAETLEEYCGCMFDKIVQDYGLNHFLDNSVKLAKNDISAEQLMSIYDAEVQYCLEQ